MVGKEGEGKRNDHVPERSLALSRWKSGGNLQAVITNLKCGAHIKVLNAVSLE